MRRSRTRLLTLGTAGTVLFAPLLWAQPVLPGLSDENEAARFLMQATFGPTREDINRLSQTLPELWILEQMELPPSLHTPAAVTRAEQLTEGQNSDYRLEVWWKRALSAPDQLRQRVAFALSEIFVVSDNDSQLNQRQLQLANYYDILVNGAFGNYRDLLENITLSPVMGLYLSHLGNDKPDPGTGRRPDENYAREVMQLFSIGLWHLEPDGSPLLDAEGQQIPTYQQETIEGFAHVFTGWTWAHRQSFGRSSAIEDETFSPMQAFADHHSQQEKQLLIYADPPGGSVIPAQEPAEPANPEGDLAIALDNIFHHPNVAPFIARQLIIKLVTSNPSPAFVQRVAATFDDDGSGVRGNLGAVVRAILLDTESRLGLGARTDIDGKLKEPLLRLSQMLRAFSATSDSGIFDVGRTEASYGQAALRAPSVFNFFSPYYRQPGPIRDLDLYSPEFQLQTESRGIAIVDDLARRVERVSGGNVGSNEVVMDLSYEVLLADDPEALIDHLNVLLFAGRMSAELRTALQGAIELAPPETDNSHRLRRAKLAVMMAVTSPEYAVQQSGPEPVQ